MCRSIVRSDYQRAVPISWGTVWNNQWVEIMRWLTRECLTGGLSDDEWERRYNGYASHLEQIKPHLSHGAELLHPEHLNLHDGQPNQWRLDGDKFQMKVLVGDEQVGFEWADIEYHDAELFPDTAHNGLARWPLTKREIGEDELTETDTGYEQRFLLWPDGEFGVRFTSCTVTRQPATASDRYIAPWARPFPWNVLGHIRQMVFTVTERLRSTT